MSAYYNPALYEEPREQPMRIVPIILRESLLSWLESMGRFDASEPEKYQERELSENLDDILEPIIYPSESELESEAEWRD
ncbi:MAG: DUF3134 domain-containing protein [Elainella sp. Prado103]|nr:DUF3134 domain-containing protein [Elainella sp. Prado103]